jgi:hypothetical protein
MLVPAVAQCAAHGRTMLAYGGMHDGWSPHCLHSTVIDETMVILQTYPGAVCFQQPKFVCYERHRV